MCVCKYISGSNNRWWHWYNSYYKVIHTFFEHEFFCSYDDSVYNEWTSGVDEVARASLEKSLLIRDPVVMHLTVNFDPKVCWKVLSYLTGVRIIDLCGAQILAPESTVVLECTALNGMRAWLRRPITVQSMCMYTRKCLGPGNRIIHTWNL